MAIQKPFSVTAKNQLQLATLLMSVFGGICEKGYRFFYKGSS